jgi:hypothetical protein
MSAGRWAVAALVLGIAQLPIRAAGDPQVPGTGDSRQVASSRIDGCEAALAHAPTPGEGVPQRGRAPWGDDLGAAAAAGLHAVPPCTAPLAGQPSAVRFGIPAESSTSTSRPAAPVAGRCG